MIVTDPAGGASLGPRLGYGSWGGFRPIRLRHYTHGTLSDSTKLMISIWFWGTLLGAGAVAGAGGAFIRTAQAVAPRVTASAFQPTTWFALNAYQERGDLASLARGERQTISVKWGVKPITMPTKGWFNRPLFIPFLLPRFDLTPVRQDDIRKLDETVSEIKLPDFIQSPGNSSQVLPAGSVSPGGTPLGWIPVVTGKRKKRRKSNWYGAESPQELRAKFPGVYSRSK